MPSITPALAEHAAHRHGIVADRELPALGIGRQRRRSLVQGGLLVPVFRGVYRLRSAPDTFHGRCLAISLADDRSGITGRAGGRLWGLRRMGQVERIEVRVPHFCHPLDQPWVHLRRCNVLDPIDFVERADGIRVMRPARLAFDLAASLSPGDLESVLEQFIAEGRCTYEELVWMDQHLHHPNRPGSREFRAVLESRPPGGAADSHPEVVLFDAMRRAGIAGLQRQFALELPSGWTIHGDIAVPSLRWMIHVDHISWHGGRIAGERDKRNDRLAQQLGWTSTRVSDHDIDHRLPQTVRELVAIHRQLVRLPA